MKTLGKMCPTALANAIPAHHSLIKMLYWMCEKTGMPPSRQQLNHAIKRNFGGLEDEHVDPVREFTSRITVPEIKDFPPEVCHFKFCIISH